MNKPSPLNLKKSRKHTDIAQKQFAESVGISTRTYRSYEDRTRGLRLEKFGQFKIHLVYDQISTDDLINVHIDYLRMTFISIRDLSHFYQTYLHCSFTEFKEIKTRPL